MEGKIRVIWDLNGDNMYKIAGCVKTREFLNKNGINPVVVRNKDKEKLKDLLSVKIALATKGKARLLVELPDYLLKVKKKRKKTEYEKKFFIELKKLNEETEGNKDKLKLLQLATLDVLLTDISFSTLKEVEIKRENKPTLVIDVKHEKIDEKIMKILKKYKKTIVPTLKKTLIDPVEIEKVWIEFETAREIVTKTYIEDGEEKIVEQWEGIVTGSAIGRIKKISIPIKKILKVKMKSVTGKIDEYKIFLPAVSINGKVFEVENTLPISLHVLKPKFITLRVEKNGKVYVRREIPVEYKTLYFGGFRFKIPSKVVVQWKLVKPTPTARLVLARKKFKSYAGAVRVYYKIKDKDGRVFSYRKYSILLFWAGHALVRISKNNVKTKEFARLYGIIIDEDTGDKYLVKLGYDEAGEDKNGVKRYYLNLIPHGYGAFVFGNQAVLLVKNTMKKVLLKNMLRTAKLYKRIYTLEGWNNELNHDIIAIEPFRVLYSDIVVNSKVFRIFIVLSTKNGQEIDILNHHHRHEGFDRITVKLNMNDILVIVHAHPDQNGRDLFRYEEFWRIVEQKLGIKLRDVVKHFLVFTYLPKDL